MKRIMAFFLVVLLLTTSAFLLVGCDNRTSEQFFADAEGYMENNEYAKAAADYVRAYKADSQNVDAYVGAIKAYDLLGVYYRIYEICDELIEVMPNNATGYLRAAEFHTYEEDYTLALEYYLRQVEMVPDEPTGYDMAVKFYYNNNDLEAAKVYAEKMIAQFPDSIDGYLYTMEILAEEGGVGEAIALGKKVLEQFPENADGYIYLGSFYYEEGDYVAATDILAQSPEQEDTRIISLRRGIRGKTPVSIEDPAIEAAVRNYGKIEEGEDVLLENVYDIDALTIDGGTITIGKTEVSPETAVESLSDLQYFESLMTLTLRGVDPLDYTEMGTPPLLTTLNISDSNLEDISFIKLLSSSLTSLTLANTGIDNFDALEQMMLLQQLDLQGNRIVRLPEFKYLSGLTILNLADNRISDLSNLEGAVELSQLTLDNNAEVTNLLPLKNLEKLTKVSVVGCGVTELSPVAHVEEVVS